MCRATRADRAGHAGGPGRPRGNPTYRILVRRRLLLLGLLDEDSFAQLVTKTFALAMAGDLGAARLLFDYCLGRPGPAPDPDNADADEVARLLARPGFPEVSAAMDAPSHAHALEMLRAYAPDDVQTFLDRTTARLRRQQEQREARQQAADAYRAELEQRVAEAGTKEPAAEA